AGVKALREFRKLGPEAIPALIRGINRAAAINHSCPVTVIAEKMRRLLASSRDVKLMQFVRDEVGAGVGPTRHAAVLQDLRVAVMLHRNALARAGFRDTTPPEKAANLRSTSELLEAA